MFRIFNSKPKPDFIHFFIVDEAGIHPIDKGYRDMGLSERWLEFYSYRRDAFNRLCFYYRLVEVVKSEDGPV